MPLRRCVDAGRDAFDGFQQTRHPSPSYPLRKTRARVFENLKSGRQSDRTYGRVRADGEGQFRAQPSPISFLRGTRLVLLL